MTQTFFSVIIPCYNAGKHLSEAVKSVLESSFQQYEIIIIDDGSDDDETLRALSTFESNSQITILRQNNQGPSIARNNGVSIAKTDWLVFLDADDKICKDTLRVFAEVVRSGKPADIYYGNLKYFGLQDEIRIQSAFDIIKMLRSNEIAICSLVRKNTFIRAGSFDEYLSTKGLEDWDLWLSLYEINAQFQHINKILFEIRVQNKGRTFDVAKPQTNELVSYIYTKHIQTLSENFLNLYHECKNIKASPYYRLGKFMLAPFRLIRHLVK